ncbi:MAG: M28 family peptidase, partial [Euryarchaeota archaeon]|nr:M28 family peptidase [Euryarchaeota archaeon]
LSDQGENTEYTAYIPGVIIPTQYGNQIKNLINQYGDVLANNLFDEQHLTVAYHFNETFNEVYGGGKDGRSDYTYLILERIPTPEELRTEFRWRFFQSTNIVNWWYTYLRLKTAVWWLLWGPNNGCRGGIIYDYNDDTYMMYKPMVYWNAKNPSTLEWTRFPAVPLFSVNGAVGARLQEDANRRLADKQLRIDYYMNQVYLEDITSDNVVGNINGKDNGKIAIIGAHYDSWWGQCSGDNAANVGIFLGLAKYIKDNNLTPKYNLRFIGFTGEEYGLSGSNFHNLVHPNDNIKYMLNLEPPTYQQLNPPDELEISTIHQNEFNIVNQIMTESTYTEKTGYNVKWLNESSSPSDDYSFNGRSGITTIGLQKERYNWTGYHRTGDNYQEGDAFKYINQTYLAITADVAWNISKYFFFDPDCRFNTSAYQPVDSLNDPDLFNDTIRATLTINTIMPDDLIRLKAALHKYPSGTIVNSCTQDYQISKPTSQNIYLTVSVPPTQPEGDYYLTVDVYNSTGRINTILALPGATSNDTSTSPVFHLHPGPENPGPFNSPPNIPINRYPQDHETNTSINTYLGWIGGDPDPDDTVTYDVYFEANDDTPDVLVSHNQINTYYDPGLLNYTMCYYWQIIARDSHNITTPSPIWSFSTCDKRYIATDLGVLGVASNVSYAYDINNQGKIVGSSGEEYGLQKAFLWNQSIMTDLGTHGGLWSEAQAINDTNAIAGTWNVRAGLWKNGVLTDLGALGGPNCVSYAYDINNHGQIVGTSYLEEHQWQPPHAFLWNGSTMIDLYTLPDDTCSVAQAINDLGQVVGTSSHMVGDYTYSHAFVWNSCGGMSSLPPLIGDANDEAYGINNHGQIIGCSIGNNGITHAVLWDSGSPINLGSLGGSKNFARSINDNRQIIGSSCIAGNTAIHAFLWENGTMKDINTLLLSSSGWILQDAYSINNNGQIVGSGTHNGSTRAFLLSPDVTPPTAPMISSSTHQNENQWYNNNDPIFTWTPSSDISGINGYSYTIDHSPNSIPETLILTTGTTKTYTDLTDGIWYFHVRAQDNAGNWGPADHYQIKIDTTAPSAPVISSSNPEGQWYNNNDPSFSWTTPSDTSGIAGYSYILDQSPSTTPDTTPEPAGTTKSYTDKPDGIWYFHCRAEDNAGNWGSADHYQINIDTTAPPAPTISSPTHPIQGQWYNNNDPQFIWTVPSDLSGIAGYSYILDQSASTTPDTNPEPAGTTTTYADVPDGTWYFHIRAKDNAGNWGTTSHYSVQIFTPLWISPTWYEDPSNAWEN